MREQVSTSDLMLRVTTPRMAGTSKMLIVRQKRSVSGSSKRHSFFIISLAPTKCPSWSYSDMAISGCVAIL